MKKNNPLVSVIIPTKNSEEFISACLNSIVKQSYTDIEVIVNDSVETCDKTSELINSYKSKLRLICIHENYSMAQGRKRGAHYAKGDILLHIDSDMELSQNVIAECVKKIRDEGYDALVIPEESFGTTFWAKCRWLEKKCYEGVSEIESIRCMKKNIYDSVSGHDEKLVFSEDKDLDLRVKNIAKKIGRTKNIILHNEGNLTLAKALNKKTFYSATASAFAKKHPKQFAWQSNLFYRYLIFLKNIKYLFIYPTYWVGIVFMKTCEFIIGASGYFFQKGYKNKHKLAGNKLADDYQLPFISYIIPTYNAEKYIEKCLKSILKQDYPKEKYEIVVIDGGSTDSTLEKVNKFPIILLKNPQRIAEYGKAIGIRKSKGEYFVLIDSDNEIVEKDWLKKMIRPILDNPGLMGVESPLSHDGKLSSLNRYLARMRIADPLAKYLVSKPDDITDFGAYKILNFHKNSIVLTGANGFLWNKKMISNMGEWREKFEESYFPNYFNNKIELSYAIPNDISIRHYYSKTIEELIKKRTKIANKVVKKINDNEFLWTSKISFIKKAIVTVYLVSIIGPLCEAIFMNIKQKTLDWFWHPIISFLTIYIYASKIYRTLMDKNI